MMKSSAAKTHACCASCHNQVQFVFGGTEISVNCFRKATGEKVGEVALSLVQEVDEDA